MRQLILSLALAVAATPVAVPVPAATRHRPLTVAEKAAALRQRLKVELSLNRRDVSVRASDLRTEAALHVVVKTLADAARLSRIRDLALAFRSVRHQAGDILKGGNTFVDVKVDRALTQPMVDRIRPELVAIDTSESSGTLVVLGAYDVKRTAAETFNVWVKRSPVSSRPEFVCNSVGAISTARRITEHALANGIETEPPPNRGGKIKPAFSVVDEAEAVACGLEAGDVISVYTLAPMQFVTASSLTFATPRASVAPSLASTMRTRWSSCARRSAESVKLLFPSR